ncbi:unnamed protein product [Bemisia tabaci]|uniref:Uncharacterized protein n=1 Tax=Bemisia tabaci TaxID=7038 RepID=A0A9P0A5K0_BEMTA|nr:unnamed protein product [Bemisia tabaci]
MEAHVTSQADKPIQPPSHPESSEIDVFHTPLKSNSEGMNLSDIKISAVSIISNLRQACKDPIHVVDDKSRAQVMTLKSTANQVIQVFESLKSENELLKTNLNDVMKRLNNLETQQPVNPAKKRVKSSANQTSNSKLENPISAHITNLSNKFDVLASEQDQTDNHNQDDDSDMEIVDTEDEEDLTVAQETNWIVKRNRRQREAFPALPQTAATTSIIESKKKNSTSSSSSKMKQTSLQFTNPANFRHLPSFYCVCLYD